MCAAWHEKIYSLLWWIKRENWNQIKEGQASEIRTRYKCLPGARKWRFLIKREGSIWINQTSVQKVWCKINRVVIKQERMEIYENWR